VGEWDAGQGGEVVAGGGAEVEFNGRWRAIAGQGDAGAVQELGKPQLVGVGQALHIGGGRFAVQWPYAEHALCR
jgi:hypothetical protein